MALIVRDEGMEDFDEEAAERDEIIIEQLVEDFVDEPPVQHDVYPESEADEEDANPVRHHTHIRRGDGRLYKHQTFFNGVAFKECVLDYVLRTSRNLRQYKYDKNKIGFKCVNGDSKGEDCAWKIYASTLPNDSMWKVRVFDDVHTCVSNGECEMFKVPQIARLFVDRIREEPEYFMPMKIEELIKERWKISVSRNQCQSARNKAMKWIENEYDIQFSRLRDYAAELRNSNIDSNVEIDTLPNAEGQDKFSRIYICFDTLRRTWKETCRPLIGVDGCFLKHKIKGQFLIALGRDADNAIYPIAWSVVQIEHRMCVRHIYGNLKKNHGSKKEMKPLIWNLAWSYNEAKFNERLDKIRCYDIGVYDDVQKANPNSWCRAFYKIGHFCEDVENNSTESFNATINKARELPFVPMLETVRGLAMARIAKRDVIAHNHKGTCTPYVSRFLAKEHKRA